MFNTAILELLIGLVFIYSLTAILVTQINTLLTNARNLRAQNLKEGLIEMVGDRTLQAEILVHPLIKLVDTSNLMMMSLSADVDTTDQILNAPLTRVADIPPETFVEALVSILTVRAFGPIEQAARALPHSEAKRRILGLLGDLQAEPSDERLAALRQAVNAMPELPGAPTLLRQRFDALQDVYTEVRSRNAPLIPLLIGISRIETPPFREAMQVVLYSANSLETAFDKLRAWFNDGMQRSSTLFREKLQRMSLIVACALVVLLNVDTLAITQDLWDDPALRASVAATARAAVNSDLADDVDAASTPASSSVIDTVLDAQYTAQQLLRLDIPLGWSFLSLTPDMAENATALGLRDPYADSGNLWNLWPPNGNPRWFSLLVLKLIGLAVSAIAAAQGAPFWFDLLRKITSRSGSSGSLR
ncbi:MAG: hypothetical protein J5J04_02760 [Anaerolineae bacterium]|jgi:hypothetical protein|nr:hypothetical protein [Anaerolineae bacterium]MDL1917595.1 hypothetical protein [Anaerolineae bacterium CFX4]OQY78504.1 MAG: hypothetical protein B6D42_16055 [Anaerolineae bacterium UTCFX5]RIK18147.1 MAG: hypothetical protein DCC53_17020 [Chloroflexota bacterium]MCO6442983.1 hypothetical protein [Anaerolineae bacterium]